MNDEYVYIDSISSSSYSQSYIIYFFLKSIVALVTSYQCLKIHYHMMSIYYLGQTTSFVLPSEEKLIRRTRKDMPLLSCGGYFQEAIYLKHQCLSSFY